MFSVAVAKATMWSAPEIQGSIVPIFADTSIHIKNKFTKSEDENDAKKGEKFMLVACFSRR
jgi:hypothetical protein